MTLFLPLSEQTEGIAAYSGLSIEDIVVLRSQAEA